MKTNIRVWVRVAICVFFVVSLYGGMALLTAAMFANGHVLIGALSGLVLSVMTALALGLVGLAWSMTKYPAENEQFGCAPSTI